MFDTVVCVCLVRIWIVRWTTKGSRSTLECKRSDSWNRRSTNSEMRRYTLHNSYNCTHMYTISSSVSHSLFQLRLQERLQEKQSLLTKKEELAAIIQSNEREIKVGKPDHPCT